MHKISIIIPIYNAEKYLGRCVDSILSQTFTDFEVLLIDDGSPDSSPAICDEYAKRDPRVRVFHKPNGGVSSARNLGLDNAKGEWITFIDADDYITKDLLYDYILDSDSSDLVIQGFSHNKDFDVSLPNQILDGEDLIDKFIDIDSEIKGFVWNKLYRRDIIKNNNIKFDENISMIEDLLFNIIFVKHCKSVRILNKINYVYFRHPKAACYKQHPFSSLSNTVFAFCEFYKNNEFANRQAFIKNKFIIYLFGLDVLRLAYKEQIDYKTRIKFIKYLKDFILPNKNIKFPNTTKHNKIINQFILHFSPAITDKLLIFAQKIMLK